MVYEVKLIKSKERVRDKGEVFTPDFLVERMLDQLPDAAWKDDKNWLEPTCGNGQFIIGILKRKILYGSTLLQALNTTFGCDIAKDNIKECRIRIYREIVLPNCKRLHHSTRLTIATIVQNNIRPVKDTLTEDFGKWQCFADLETEERTKRIDAYEQIFKMIDEDKQPAHNANQSRKNTYEELLALKR